MIIMDHLVEEDKLIPKDQRTMEELRKMGNSICPMIQLEEDFPSKHDNKLLPILDLKVQVQQVEQENQPSLPKLFYYYYRKPMANWQLMPAASAMPSSDQENLPDTIWSPNPEKYETGSSLVRESGDAVRVLCQTPRLRLLREILPGNYPECSKWLEEDGTRTPCWQKANKSGKMLARGQEKKR